jgi:hypothetical protein
LVGKHTEPDMGEFADQGVEVFEFIADVKADDGSAHFRTTLKEPFNAITFKPPEVGQTRPRSPRLAPSSRPAEGSRPGGCRSRP